MGLGEVGDERGVEFGPRGGPGGAPESLSATKSVISMHYIVIVMPKINTEDK